VASPEASKLLLRAYQLDSSFLWAPPAARIALLVWTRDVFIAITAADTEPFVDLFGDCQGDVLDCFAPTMTHDEMLLISERWSACPQVCAWLRGIAAAAAVATGDIPEET